MFYRRLVLIEVPPLLRCKKRGKPAPFIWAAAEAANDGTAILQRAIKGEWSCPLAATGSLINQRAVLQDTPRVPRWKGDPDIETLLKDASPTRGYPSNLAVLNNRIICCHTENVLCNSRGDLLDNDGKAHPILIDNEALGRV